ncbi:chlororespiratory reduction protein 7 [Synechococcus sp. CS-1328]|uniref:chlororespiratory reduction protein 7 n=1 Tax=Synechococcus sp. CS-1328 TaxID=2847976 RepID=UPI00223A6F4E|nr:chlororespiratory reduction protein 7 [Synechococcus sp. CS-1328]MCT0224624.1 chlororespiratory reduction protein 7 [Synechococcus sp. CS-1328]
MSDPLMRELDHYVVLEPGQPEQILDVGAALVWLAAHLERLPAVPEDLAGLADAQAQAERLLDTACELELAPGLAIQWFAVRLEPGGHR